MSRSSSDQLRARAADCPLARVAHAHVPALVAGIVSVQPGRRWPKGLFPALGPIGTVGPRVALSAIMLLAAGAVIWLRYGVLTGFLSF